MSGLDFKHQLATLEQIRSELRVVLAADENWRALHGTGTDAEAAAGDLERAARDARLQMALRGNPLYRAWESVDAAIRALDEAEGAFGADATSAQPNPGELLLRVPQSHGALEADLPDDIRNLIRADATEDEGPERLPERVLPQAVTNPAELLEELAVPADAGSAEECAPEAVTVIEALSEPSGDEDVVAPEHGASDDEAVAVEPLQEELPPMIEPVHVAAAASPIPETTEEPAERHEITARLRMIPLVEPVTGTIQDTVPDEAAIAGSRRAGGRRQIPTVEGHPRAAADADEAVVVFVTRDDAQPATAAERDARQEERPQAFAASEAGAEEAEVMILKPQEPESPAREGATVRRLLKALSGE